MISTPQVTFADDLYRFDWKSESVSLVMDRLHESRSSGLACEVTIESAVAPAGLLHGPSTFNLLTSKRQLVNELADQRGDVDWNSLLLQASAIGVKRWREGDPLIDLATVVIPPGSRWLLPGFLESRGVTVIAAAGGAGKSMFALGCALTIATGAEVIGITPSEQKKVAYLDWEADAETHHERMRALWASRGDGPLPEDAILYRRQVASMVETAQTLRRQLAQAGVGFVVIDSAAYARGGGVSDDEATNRMFLAIRSLNVPALVVDHLNRQTIANPKLKALPIGSVYGTNAPRRVWVLRADAQALSLTDEKRNNTAQQPMLAYTVRYENDEEDAILEVSYSQSGMLSLPPSVQSGRKYQVAAALKARGGAATLDELSADVGISTNNIRVVMNRSPEWFAKGREGDRWAFVEGTRDDDEPSPF